MTYRKGKFFVHLIVNFNEIQHYTWLGTFWSYVYKYTYTCKFTKNFYIHCATLAFLLLLGRDYQPGPFLLNYRYYCPAPLNSSFLSIPFSAWLHFSSEYQDLTNFLFILDFFLQCNYLISTSFLTG